MPRLTEQEQQEIIRFLEADKPLPEKYRFLLFDDKREVELVWNGKTNEVCHVSAPFSDHRTGGRAEGGKNRGYANPDVPLRRARAPTQWL